MNYNLWGSWSYCRNNSTQSFLPCCTEWVCSYMRLEAGHFDVMPPLLPNELPSRPREDRCDRVVKSEARPKMDGPPPPDDFDDEDLDEMMANAPPEFGEPSSADLEVRVASRRPEARGAHC